MLVKRYLGRIVKRMRRVPGGILITFLSKNPGDRGQQLLISQEDWNKNSTQSYQRITLAELRRQSPE
jgi:hypothetical protein